MRFDELRDLTTLPSERLASAFRGERVLSVLPVSGSVSGEATILVATPTKLGVATLARDRSRWVTRWAPWDAVGIRVPCVMGAGRRRRSRDRLRTAVRVGGRTFPSVLHGAPGQAALRDFARTVRARRRALDLAGIAV